MENEIKVGDWIRTKAGQIHKVTKITPYYENNKLVYDRQGIYWDNRHSGYEIWQLEDIIVKHSPNLIDIIEERRLCKWNISNRKRKHIVVDRNKRNRQKWISYTI